MYANSQSPEPLASLPAGSERADDADLAPLGIYHIREVYPVLDPATEVVDYTSFTTVWDASAQPYPVWVRTYAKRAMTSDEVAAYQAEQAAIAAEPPMFP